jgi:hypothetical protein
MSVNISAQSVVFKQRVRHFEMKSLGYPDFWHIVPDFSDSEITDF